MEDNTFKIHVQFQFEKVRSVIGILLAAFSFFVCLAFHARNAAAFLGIGFLVTALFHVRDQYKGVSVILNLLWAVTSLIGIGVYCPSMVGAQFLAELPDRIFWLNLLCIFLMFLLWMILTGNIRFSAIITAVLLFLVSLINAFVFQFRGREVSVADVLSIGTALNVAGQYEFAPNS